MMDLAIFHNHSEILAFKNFKRLLSNYFPKFVKASKDQSNSFSDGLNTIQFIVLFMIARQTQNIFGTLIGFYKILVSYG